MKTKRADSISAAVEAACAVAEGPLAPPAHVQLDEGDMPFWNAIVCARARSTWNDVDLATAANLARCQADIERIGRELRVEGDTTKNDRGTMVSNPKHAILETMTRRATALKRLIHVHAEATVGKSEDASKKLGAEKKATKAARDADDVAGGLIPGLRAVK